MSAAATNDAASFRVPTRYRFQKHLGSGSYGVVAAFHDQDRGRDVAIKRVRKVFDNYLVLRRTLREIRLMSHFRHPNLMRLHKVLPLEASGDLYMSLELMDCDLDTLVHTKRVVLTDQQVRCFTAQILLGLMAMHAGHVIHRDLKPANIFVRLNRGQVKIGDLGLSRGIAVNEETGEATHPSDECLTEYVVTRWYRAPEVLLARSKYGPPVDVWSVGAIVYEMCSRKALFPGKNSYDQLKRILAVLGGPSEADTTWVPRESMPLLQKCYPSGGSSQRGQGLSSLTSGVVSADGMDLLQQMCLFNPNQRIGVEQALLHPYLAGITSEQDRKTARAVDPADVAYDKLFDGVGKQGEGAALVQLGRLLRREVAKFNPIRADTTPERSQADRKTASTVRTPRSGPQSMAEASYSAAGSARGAVSSKVPSEPPLPTQSSSERSSSAHQQSELLRRRSEPEADVWSRRSGHGAVVTSRTASNVPTALPTRRRSENDGRPGALETRRHLERLIAGEESQSSHVPLTLPMAPPPSGPVPSTAIWMAEEKSPSKPSQRSGRTECSAGNSLRKRIPGISQGSATTVSTRATPQGSRPGTEASTRASSRLTSTSRPRVPSVGPQQWAAEPEGFYLGPNSAATASPRAGPPVLLGQSDESLIRRHDEVHHSARKNCWGPEDQSKADHGSHSDRFLHRALRESASTNNPTLPPDLSNHHPSRHDSLASLDDVLREMKAMIRNAPEERDEVKQERSRQHIATKVSSNSKPSGSKSGSRLSGGLRGHRAAAVGRGAETSDDRSPSCGPSSQSARAPFRRNPSSARTERGEHRTVGRQRSHDELDFAVSEPFPDTESRRTPQRGEGSARGEAHASVWAESRKPLESLEPEEGNSPRKDLGPPLSWARKASAMSLRDGEQDWKHLQFSWNSATGNSGEKAHNTGGHHQRQLPRTGSTVRRAAASENSICNANISGLGLAF